MTCINSGRELIRLALVNIKVAIIGYKYNILAPWTESFRWCIVFDKLVHHVPGLLQTDDRKSAHTHIHGSIFRRIFSPLALARPEEGKVVVGRIGFQRVQGISGFISRHKVGIAQHAIFVVIGTTPKKQEVDSRIELFNKIADGSHILLSPGILVINLLGGNDLHIDLIMTPSMGRQSFRLTFEVRMRYHQQITRMKGYRSTE